MGNPGNCGHCGHPLSIVWFEEEEEKMGYPYGLYKTGRRRQNASHLTCTNCLRNVCVDGDTFAQEWFGGNNFYGRR